MIMNDSLWMRYVGAIELLEVREPSIRINHSNESVMSQQGEGQSQGARWVVGNRGAPWHGTLAISESVPWGWVGRNRTEVHSICIYNTSHNQSATQNGNTKCLQSRALFLFCLSFNVKEGEREREGEIGRKRCHLSRVDAPIIYFKHTCPCPYSQGNLRALDESDLWLWLCLHSRLPVPILAG